MAWNMKKEPILLEKQFIVRFLDGCELRNSGFHPGRIGCQVWYLDASKKSEGTGASSSFGQYITVIRGEIYAIMACGAENMDRGCENRDICTLLDSQAAIKALYNYKINHKFI
jgi:hypothetical protein